MSWVYVVSKGGPVPTAVFTRLGRLIVWLGLQDMEFFTEWKVYRFADDQRHDMGQQSFVELGSALSVLESDRANRRIKSHVAQSLGEGAATTEDLRIFEVRTAADAYDLTADEIAEETIEDGRLIDSDELSDVLDLKVGEKVQLGTFVVVTRKSDRDREGMVEAGPDPRREAFK